MTALKNVTFAATGESTARSLASRFGECLNIKAFGAVGDGSTDDTAAFLAFQTRALAIQTASGRGIALYLPAGTYKFSDQNWPKGIKKLHVYGPGAILEQTSAVQPNCIWSATAFFGATLGDGINLISATAVGDVSITLTTAANVSQYDVGQYIMVASLDVQGGGYPPNYLNFDFVKIVSKNAGTGQIVIDRPLQHAHLTTYPDHDDAYGPGSACVYDLDYSGTSWDVDHTFEGLQFVQGPGGAGYMSVGGRKVTFISCKFPGASSTIGQHHTYIDCEFNDDTEDDKLVERLVRINCDHSVATTSEITHLGTSGIKYAHYQGATILGAATLGAQNTVLDSCTVNGTLSLATLGLIENASIRNCRINGAVSISHSGPGDSAMTAAAADYSNGTIRVLKSADQNGLQTLVPGQRIWPLAGSAGQNYVLNLCGIVTAVRDDATYVYIDTTLPETIASPFRTVPFMFQRENVRKYRFDNCSGSETARLASELNGRKEKSYLKFDVNGYLSATKNFEVFGYFKYVRVNIIKPYTGINAVTLSLNFSQTHPDGFANTQGVELIFDADTAGTREYTLAALTGQVAGDLLKLNNVTQSWTELPRRWVGKASSALAVSWGGESLSGQTTNNQPMAEVEIEMDQGLFGTDMVITGAGLKSVP